MIKLECSGRHSIYCLGFGIMDFVPSSSPLPLLPHYVGGLTCIKSILLGLNTCSYIAINAFLCVRGSVAECCPRLLELILESSVVDLYGVNASTSKYMHAAQGQFDWAMYTFRSIQRFKIHTCAVFCNV